MAATIKNTAHCAARIKATSARATKRVDARTVAQAFGARPAGIGTGGDSNPFSLWQLRGELERLLQSTGGRPALPTEGERVKIPKIPSDWTFIEAVAANTANLPLRPSPAQVAAVMLHMAVSRFSADEIANALQREKAA
ncbi:MAG: hypothetical protein Q8M11_09545 [Sulfuritalea sp.]|jgi:hypothetical protein|nr:hypothetical protein [Sulfuritalea sp.]MDP1984028.1 hypothetical protein [Sulfuritalea sp.]